MIALIQRVTEASVTIARATSGFDNLPLDLLYRPVPDPGALCQLSPRLDQTSASQFTTLHVRQLGVAQTDVHLGDPPQLAILQPGNSAEGGTQRLIGAQW